VRERFRRRRRARRRFLRRPEFVLLLLAAELRRAAALMPLKERWAMVVLLGSIGVSLSTYVLTAGDEQSVSRR
jgi:hypothetical protein